MSFSDKVVAAELSGGFNDPNINTNTPKTTKINLFFIPASPF